MSNNNPNEPLFPIHLHRDGEALPEAPCAFLIARNGSFVQRNTIAFQAVVPTKEIPSLATLEPTASYLLPPMPAVMVKQMLLFFQKIWQQQHTEALLILSYHPTRQTFRLDAPEQTVSVGHIRYGQVQAAKGFILVGTAHSHGSLGAFHSGVDTHDEETFDGIHLTFGHVDEPLVEIVASLAIGGHRFPQAVETVLGGTTYRQQLRQLKQPARKSPSLEAARGRPYLGHRHTYRLDPYLFRQAAYERQNGFQPPRRTPVIRWINKGYEVEVPDDTPPAEYEPLSQWFAAVHLQPPPLDPPLPVRTGRKYASVDEALRVFAGRSAPLAAFHEPPNLDNDADFPVRRSGQDWNIGSPEEPLPGEDRHLVSELVRKGLR